MHSFGLAHYLVLMRALVAASVFVSIGFVLAARVAYNSYRVIANEFAPAPASTLLFHPDLAHVAGLSEVTFRSSDGLQLAGWYVPSHNGAAVIVCHGTNADRSSMLSEIRILANAGFGVLAFDWPGEGRSEGQIHWNATERHALTAAVDFVSSHAEVQPGGVGVLGFSMGGLIAAQVAAVDPRLQAVVLEAAPTDFGEYAQWSNRRWGFFSIAAGRWAIRRARMPVDEQRPVLVVNTIAPRALLVLAGAEDQVVPEAMTRRLYAAAAEPKTLWIIPGAGHGQYADVAPVEYGEKLVDFFAAHLRHQGRQHA